MTDVHRDLGAHGEAIRTLQKEVTALRGDVAEIKAMIAASKGGLRMLMAVGGVAAAIGSVATKLWEHLT
ncbi:MAG: hypothetical protein IRZ07_00570 [Microbispora sp.]|nr:hypothetical protein [Microbispora sp.]